MSADLLKWVSLEDPRSTWSPPATWSGVFSRGALVPGARCALRLLRAHPERPDCYPLPNGPLRRAKRFGHETRINTRSLPQTLHNQEHNTMGTHFIIFEMALGPLWPSAVPESAHQQRGPGVTGQVQTTTRQTAAPHGRSIGCPPSVSRKISNQMHRDRNGTSMMESKGGHVQGVGGVCLCMWV